jgi:hypothetical protein
MLSSQTLGKLCQDKTIKENEFFGMVMCHTNYTCGIDMFFGPDGEIKGRSQMCADVAHTIQNANSLKRKSKGGGGGLSDLYRYIFPTEVDKAINRVYTLAKKTYDQRDTFLKNENEIRQLGQDEQKIQIELVGLQAKTKDLDQTLASLRSQNVMKKAEITGYRESLTKQNRAITELKSSVRTAERLQKSIAENNEKIGALKTSLEIVKKSNGSKKVADLLRTISKLEKEISTTENGIQQDRLKKTTKIEALRAEVLQLTLENKSAEDSLEKEGKDLEQKKGKLQEEREKTVNALVKVVEQKASITQQILHNAARLTLEEAKLREVEGNLQDVQNKLSNLDNRIASVTGKIDQLQGSTKMYFASALHTIENNQGNFILGGLASMGLFILYYGMKVFREYTKTKIQKKQEEENALFKEPGLPPSYLFALLEMPIETRKIELFTKYDFVNCLLLMKPDGTPRITQEDCDLALSKYGAIEGYLVKKKRHQSSSGISKKKSRQSRSRRHLSVKAA